MTTAGVAPGRCRTTRVFTVLELISRTRGARLTQIADASGLPVTTTHRLLAELVELGVIERRSEGYQIGSALFDIAFRAPARAELLAAVRPALHDLYASTRATLYLAILSGSAVSVMDVVGGGELSGIRVRSGDQLAAHATAAGKCLLATAGSDTLPVKLERLVPRTVTSSQVFAQQLQSVRALGYAVDVEEWQVGVASVAAPVVSEGHVVGVVAVALPVHHFNPHRWGSQVVNAARAASARLASGRAHADSRERVA
ncbi:IclR family transcriptional regulator [Pseudonocardia ailaonensis]|uniref:IclR family transcriptional regulator n=1 Tax=Pseudonocardia ailaonensis TaxID=367279 RepID=A0ABN2NB46_9PSEU